MIEIYIEYNPFSLEFIIQQDGKDFYKDSKIHKYKQSRLQNWVDKLIPEIYKVIKSKFNLVFKGTILDYEDIQEEASKFNELKNKEIVTLSYIEIRTVNDRLKELKELFNYMQDTAPFEELKTKDVIKKFDKAINRELEIAAIATISAGKSTLIAAWVKLPTTTICLPATLSNNSERPSFQSASPTFHSNKAPSSNSSGLPLRSVIRRA